MKYVILSITHGTGERACFWRADCAGFTEYPFNAGQYDEAVVLADPDYYNNGYDSVAIPLTDGAMHTLGFKCTYEEGALSKFLQISKSNQ